MKMKRLLETSKDIPHKLDLRTGGISKGAINIENENTSAKMRFLTTEKSWIQAWNAKNNFGDLEITGFAGNKLNSFNIAVNGNPTVNGNAIYTTAVKPSPDDINAVSSVESFAGGNDLNTYNSNKTWTSRAANSTLNRPGDYFSVVNFGMNTNSNFQLAHSYSNLSSFYVRGRHDVTGNYTPWARVYTTQYKPTSDDVGALSKAGGTLTGALICNRNIEVNAAGYNFVAPNNYGYQGRDTNGVAKYMLWMNTSNQVSLGIGSNDIKIDGKTHVVCDGANSVGPSNTSFMIKSRTERGIVKFAMQSDSVTSPSFITGDDGDHLTLNLERYGTLKIKNSQGYVRIGCNNGGFAHYYTDRGNHYFDKPVNSGGFCIHDGNNKIWTISSDNLRNLNFTNESEGTTFSLGARGYFDINTLFLNGHESIYRSTVGNNNTTCILADNWAYEFRSDGQINMVNGNTRVRVVHGNGFVSDFNIPDNKSHLVCNIAGGNSYGIDWWASDLKLKENVLLLNSKRKNKNISGLDTIKKIEHYSFSYKDNQPNVSCGYIGQQLEEINQDFVMKVKQKEDSENYDEKDPFIRQPRPSRIIPYITKAIQEQQEIIEKLKLEIELLKAK